jgi:ATP-binding cassette subfamily A (ABC1) protein 3
MGFMFKSYGNAQVGTFFLNFLQSIIAIVIFVLRLIPSTKEIGNALQYIFRLIPSYSFASAVINIANIDLLTVVEGR